MDIRKYNHEDIPKILQLIRAVYDERVYEKAVGRFEWQYERNPGNTPEGPVIFVLEDSDRIIGMIGAFAQRLKIDDHIYPAYWLVDLMVHPDARRIFYHAPNLIRKITSHPGLGMGFPGVGGEKNKINPWLRIGATPFSQLVEYSGITWHFDLWIDSLFNKSLKEIQIIDIKHFDERFDRLWEKISKNYRVIQVRDSSFLNWRFFECPHLAYRVLAAVKNKEILGYVVVRDEKLDKIHEGNIVDIFFDKSDGIATKALINAGIRALKNSGCNVIKMVVSADDQFLNDILCRYFFGFCEKRERGLFLNNTSHDINSIMEVSSNWFLTKTDLDSEFSW